MNSINIVILWLVEYLIHKRERDFVPPCKQRLKREDKIAPLNRKGNRQKKLSGFSSKKNQRLLELEEVTHPGHTASR